MKPSSSAQNLMSGSLNPENISLASEKTVSSLQVVIVSASIGAGHDYATRELRERLIRVGVDVSVCDYVQSVALPLRLLLRSYETLVNHLPWLFNYVIVSTDEGSSWLLAFLVFLGCATSRRWLLRCTAGADAVVSTHALATQSLGELKRRGALEAPLASYLCDAGMHRLLFHQAVSLNMVLLEAVRPNAGEETALMPEWSSRWCGRSSEIFIWPCQRAALHQELGVPDGSEVVIISAGSLGLNQGRIVDTVADVLAERPSATVVALCGKNAALRSRLGQDTSSRVVALGWRTDIPSLLAAAHVMVHSVGGMAVWEALTMGLPVITYRPLPGHGRINARMLAAAGVSPWPQTQRDLGRAIRTAVRRERHADKAVADCSVQDCIVDPGNSHRLS